MHDSTILILENAHPASVAFALDILAAAAALAPREGVSRPRWRVCSVGGKDIAL